MELQETTDTAYAAFVKATLAAFEKLRQLDPELVEVAMDASGSARLSVMVFAHPGGSNQRSVHARLAAGGAEEVRDRMVRSMYGMF